MNAPLHPQIASSWVLIPPSDVDFMLRTQVVRRDVVKVGAGYTMEVWWTDRVWADEDPAYSSLVMIDSRGVHELAIEARRTGYELTEPTWIEDQSEAVTANRRWLASIRNESLETNAERSTRERHEAREDASRSARREAFCADHQIPLRDLHR